MSEAKTTNDIYEKLNNRITYPILLYMPTYLDKLLSEKKDFEVLRNLFGFLLAVQSDEENFIANEDSNMLFMMDKAKILNRNLFDLMDAKANLSEEQFEFLLSKYKDQLDAFAFIAETLKLDITSSKNKVLKKHKGYIIYQATTFYQHQLEVEKQFPTSQKSSYTIDLKSLIFNSQQLSNKATGVEQQISNKPPTKKKRVIITNEEADSYLLQSVFHLKL